MFCLKEFSSICKYSFFPFFLDSWFSAFSCRKNRLPEIWLRRACDNTKIKWQNNAMLSLLHILNSVKIKVFVRIQTFVFRNFEHVYTDSMLDCNTCSRKLGVFESWIVMTTTHFQITLKNMNSSKMHKTIINWKNLNIIFFATYLTLSFFYLLVSSYIIFKVIF